MTPHLSPHSVSPSLLDYSDQHNEDLLSAIHSDFRKKSVKKKFSAGGGQVFRFRHANQTTFFLA